MSGMIRRLLALEGVNVVCQFRDDGSFVVGYGRMSQEDMVQMARFAHDYRRMAQGIFDDLARCMRLPMPAAGISSITVQASDGTQSTISSSNYTLQDDELGSFVRFKDSYSFPSDLYETKAIGITFTAGFGAASAVPADIKVAMLMLIGHWFANREAVNIGNITSSLPLGFDAMVSKYRRVGV